MMLISLANFVVISISTALKILDSYSGKISEFYRNPVVDYRGRTISSKSVLNYLETEKYRFAEVASMLPDPPSESAKLLDIGIAYGFLPALISSESRWKCEGLEVGENIPAYCKFAQQCGITIHEGLLGVKPLSFKDSTFDAVLLSEVLEHLRLSPPLIFRELNRILKPGGLLIVTTPNIARLTNIVKLTLGKNVVEEFPRDKETDNVTEYMTHIREYTMNEVCDLLLSYGFKVRHKQFSSCMEQNKPHRFLTKLLPRFRGNLMVLGQKQKAA